MIWWNIKKLKTLLIERPLSSSEKFSYLLANTIVLTLSVGFAELASESSAVLVAANTAATLVIAIVGCIYVYHCNGGKDGAQLLTRFTAIGWVVFVRWTAIGIPILVLVMLCFLIAAMVLGIALAGKQFNPDSIDRWLPIISLPLEWAWMLFYYQRLGSHVKDVAKKSS